MGDYFGIFNDKGLMKEWIGGFLLLLFLWSTLFCFSLEGSKFMCITGMDLFSWEWVFEEKTPLVG